MKIREKYLKRALEIAARARGCDPNPAVGAVVEAGGRIIGEGYTAAYGGPHAEVRAIRSVHNPELLREATLYVTLEPCCHHGKTPPCTDRILESGIPRVVVGIKDPNPAVAGRGIRMLEAAGCTVISGLLEAECREHHRVFLTVQEKKRPYILLKWAQSRDGYLAPPDSRRSEPGQPHWITGMAARQWVHKWRTEVQAILVGRKTAYADNPRLDSRLWTGPDPLRVVLDPGFKTPAGHHLLDGTLPTLFATKGNSGRPCPKGVAVLEIPEAADMLDAVLDELRRRDVASLLVEGGRDTLNGFIERDLWDEARILTGTSDLGSGLPAPRLAGRLAASGRIGSDRFEFRRND